jgi:very-short-patch-repair endonuclease
MPRPFDSYEYLITEYVEKGRSTKNIAEEHNTYPMTIRRCLKRHGIDVRNKSQAQKTFVSINGSPIKGRKRTEEEKEQISIGLQEYWGGMTDVDRKKQKEKLAQAAINQWNALSDTDKEAMIHRMHLGSKGKVGGGSKNENCVAEMVVDKGHRTVTRSKAYSPGNRFEIDIALPDIAVAIEWDGVTHFMPIYGEKHLKGVQDKDNKKDEDLMRNGWSVVRCRDYSTAHSKAFCRRAVKRIFSAIEQIKKDGEIQTVYLDMK